MHLRDESCEEGSREGRSVRRAGLRLVGAPWWVGAGLWGLSAWLTADSSHAGSASCPAAMSAGLACSSEQAQAHQRCSYPQGSCVCALVPPCNGAALAPGPGAAERRWECLPAGCPSDPVSQTGKACSTPGQECTYGSCPQISYRCEPSGWALQSVSSTPPSSGAAVGPRPQIAGAAETGGSRVASEPSRGAASAQPGGASGSGTTHQTAKPSWQACSGKGSFTCQSVQQGVAASEHRPPPKVCGCAPRCPSGYRLMASMSGTTWPDGSEKAAYSCVPPNAGSPPSVARPH